MDPEERIEGEELETEELETEELETEDEGSDEEGEEETPLWLQEGEEEQDSSEAVPEAALISVKKKLKSKISDRDEEIERLKAENEQLKAGQTKPEVAPTRPRRKDFVDDDEYEAALDKYEEERADYNFRVMQASSNNKEAVQKRVERVQKSVDDHYTRAAKLVESTSINPDVYKQATETVQQTLEKVFPKGGEAAFNQFIDVTGEGSEKAIFYIGRNKPMLNELQSRLMEDKSGLSAALFIGRITERLNGTKKQTSRAPKPAPKVEGEGGSGKGQERKFLKRYQEAHKNRHSQKAYDIKKEAKAAGIDTSKWS